MSYLKHASLGLRGTPKLYGFKAQEAVSPQGTKTSPTQLPRGLPGSFVWTRLSQTLRGSREGLVKKHPAAFLRPFSYCPLRPPVSPVLSATLSPLCPTGPRTAPSLVLGPGRRSPELRCCERHAPSPRPACPELRLLLPTPSAASALWSSLFGEKPDPPLPGVGEYLPRKTSPHAGFCKRH